MAMALDFILFPLAWRDQAVRLDRTQDAPFAVAIVVKALMKGARNKVPIALDRAQVLRKAMLATCLTDACHADKNIVTRLCSLEGSTCGRLVANMNGK
ncbi:hypothetical protein [Ensifer canadensis]